MAIIETWQLQDAKNRFSELVKKALADGPQIVTKRGVESVVVLSVKEYRKLKQPKNDLVAFFRQSPLRNVDVDLSRITGCNAGWRQT
ncbi:type II toxin-antitoxin system Phd/YefM family antitoxin [uncultured Desulfosarcina sp.]|uniref:type II toxin-antitoxin system Phd/YefM family antitoxin n=1 Tax=uncultured Desulfosarcina sp. TaxID=218289 RepID=UPI0029C97906|nr:type II toxin-antitoxin system Phd/YefM family antitoxin [uncultured Desulfosarcina sp.]